MHDLAGPNSFFTRDLAVLDKAILITQDAEGAVRTFYNVCSHRGMKLVWEDHGPCPRALVCRFHGWAYGKDGALQSVTDEGEFHFASKDDVGLVPIRTELWNGFIFVNFDEDGTDSVTDHLGPIASKFDEFPFHLLRLEYRYDAPERANWKIAIDAQNEIYHIPILAPLHRFFAQGAFASNDDGYTRLNSFTRMGPCTPGTRQSPRSTRRPRSPTRSLQGTPVGMSRFCRWTIRSSSMSCSRTWSWRSSAT